MISPSKVEQARAAVAVLTYVAGESEAGREADTEVLCELIDETVPEAIIMLAGAIVARVSAAREELERIGRTLACREGEAE